MSLSRQERILLHKKSQAPHTGVGTPSNLEGKDGDTAYRRLPGVGIVHYIKRDGEWQALSSTDRMPAKRSTIRVSGGAGSGITDHGGMSGLSDDDHEQYLLIDGTRAVTGDLSLSGGDGALTFTVAGENSIKIPDNQASALIIEEANNAYLTFNTANSGGEKITLGKKLEAGSVEIEGTAFDINGGDISAGTISGGLTWSSAQNLNSQALTNVNIDSGDISATTISGGLTWSAAQDLNNVNLTNVDIDSGAIDGTTIGSSSHTTIKGTTIDATTDFTVGTVVITTNQIQMTPSDSDTIRISGTTHGALYITTVDDAAAAANIVVTADGTLDLNSVALDIDASGAVTIDGASTLAIAGASTSTYGDDVAVWSFNGSGAVSETGMTTFSLTPSSDVTILSGGDLFLDAQEIVIGDDNDVPINIDATTFDLDATSWIRIDGAGLSLDSTAASNFTTSGGALTLTSAAAATWSTAAGNLTVDSAAGTLVLDGHTGITLDASNSGNIEINVTAADDILIGNDAVAQDILLGNAAATQVDLTAILVDINGGSSGVTIDGAAASNFTTSAGAITIDAQASTVTVDGHTGVTVKSSNSGDIWLDSVADVVLDAAGGNFEFKDAGTTQFTIDVNTTAGDIDINLNVNGDDLVFNQYDGSEVLRLKDEEVVVIRNCYVDDFAINIKPEGSGRHYASGTADYQENYSMHGFHNLQSSNFDSNFNTSSGEWS